MRNLGLADLLIALRNLTTERSGDLLLSNTGKAYAPKLTKQLKQIEALPEAQRGARPLAQELGSKDQIHDGFGEAIFHLTGAVLTHPTAPAEMKASAQRVRDTFVPKLGVLRVSYADEAAAALRKRPLVGEHKADLQAIAVPYPAGASLLDWVTSFLDAGDAINQLLNDRSLAGAEQLSVPAMTVRTTTLGILSRFRAALLDEIEDDTTLPRDLEARIFSYFDQLQSTREDAAARRTKNDDDTGTNPT